MAHCNVTVYPKPSLPLVTPSLRSTENPPPPIMRNVIYGWPLICHHDVIYACLGCEDKVLFFNSNDQKEDVDHVGRNPEPFAFSDRLYGSCDLCRLAFSY